LIDRGRLHHRIRPEPGLLTRRTGQFHLDLVFPAVVKERNQQVVTGCCVTWMW